MELARVAGFIEGNLTPSSLSNGCNAFLISVGIALLPLPDENSERLSYGFNEGRYI